MTPPLALVLLQSLTTHATPIGHPLLLLGRAPEATRAELGATLPLPLPLATLDERQPRARIDDELVHVALPGIGTATSAAALSLHALQHSRGEQVLRSTLAGVPLLLGGAGRLPATALLEEGRDWIDALPQLARRDEVEIAPQRRLRLDFTGSVASDLLVVRGRSIGRDGTRDEQRWWPLAEVAELALPFHADSLAIVAARELDAGALVRLEQHSASVTGDTLELTFAAPPIPGAGGTWTLLFDSTLAPSQPRAAPPGAAAPGAAEPGPWRDVARERGIAFVHLEGPEPQLDIRPTMGPGLAWGDADGDGWCDLYLAQGAGRSGSAAPLDRLYSNQRGRGFRDTTPASGIRDEAAGMGVTFLDLEGDGDLDLYVANYGRDRVYRNLGVARFEDATDALGIGGERWHAGVAAADYDQDGDVDVYVTSYLEYAPEKMPPREDLAYQRDDPVEMLPFAFPGQPNTLWRNELEHGALRFVDVAPELGLDDPAGRGMQALWWDYDGDADLDLYVANDVSPNKLFRNEGAGRFKDVSFSTGVDDPRGCMGLAAEDVDGDQDLDLFVTNWQLEANALYLNNLVNARSQKTHVASFRDAIVQARLAGPGVGLTKWGVEFLDNDRDGDLDLFYANGYTSPDYESTGICVGQPCQYFEQHAPLRFAEPASDALARHQLAHRALAACDWDQDGDLDLALSANNGPFRLLEWHAEAAGRWLGIRLRQPGANPLALGAQVRVRAGARSWLRELRAGSSYLAGNPPELHFGLGARERVDEVEVRWPDGARTQHAVDGLDRWVTLRRP